MALILRDSLKWRLVDLVVRVLRSRDMNSGLVDSSSRLESSVKMKKVVILMLEGECSKAVCKSCRESQVRNWRLRHPLDARAVWT